MMQSFKYAFKNLKNTKGFLSSMFIMPLIMILIVTLTLSYADTPLVGVVKGEYTGDFSLSSLRTKTLDVQEADYFLGSAEGTLVIYLNRDGSLQKIYSSVANNPLTEQLKRDMSQQDEPFAERASVHYSLGIILFKLITAGSLLATILIQEKNQKIFVRLKNARIGIFKHILGKLLTVLAVYDLANIAIIIFYQTSGFHFGKTSAWGIWIVFNIALLFSLSFYTFVASFLKNEGYIWLTSTGLFFPLALLSGAIFPSRYMPEWMKLAATISPQYHLNEMLLSGELSLNVLLIILLLSGGLLVTGIHKMKRAA